MKKVLVVNQFNSENLGDKLLNSALCEALKIQGLDVIPCGYAMTVNQEIEYNDNRERIIDLGKIKRKIPAFIKFILKYRRALRKQFDQITMTDIGAIIIGGGQLIKAESVFRYCFAYWIKEAQKNKIPAYVFGVGVDDNLSKTAFIKYKKLLEKVEWINCRDGFSYDILRNKMEFNCSYSPDIAFLHRIKDAEKKYIVVMPYNYDTAVNAFGLSENKEAYYSAVFEKLSPFIKGDANVIIAATTTSDAQESYEFNNWIKKKGISAKLVEINTLNEFDDLFAEAKVVVSGRMHALIMGILAGAFVVPIVVSQKIRQFSNEYIDLTPDLNKIRENTLLGVEQLVKRIYQNE